MLNYESEERFSRIPAPPITLYQLQETSASASTFDGLPLGSGDHTGQLSIILQLRSESLIVGRRFIAEQEQPKVRRPVQLRPTLETQRIFFEKHATAHITTVSGRQELPGREGTEASDRTALL
jgi:hypothetical protein